MKQIHIDVHPHALLLSLKKDELEILLDAIVFRYRHLRDLDMSDMGCTVPLMLTKEKDALEAQIRCLAQMHGLTELQTYQALHKTVSRDGTKFLQPQEPPPFRK